MQTDLYAAACITACAYWIAATAVLLWGIPVIVGAWRALIAGIREGRR